MSWVDDYPLFEPRMMMTIKQASCVLAASAAGKPIQFRHLDQADAGMWIDMDRCIGLSDFDFQFKEYRVKTEKQKWFIKSESRPIPFDPSGDPQYWIRHGYVLAQEL